MNDGLSIFFSSSDRVFLGVGGRRISQVWRKGGSFRYCFYLVVGYSFCFLGFAIDLGLGSDVALDIFAFQGFRR